MYDPLGLIQPVVIKLKLGLRDIIVYSKTHTVLNWDDALPEFMYKMWFNLVKEIFEVNSLSFIRRLTPIDYDSSELPWIITFSDGSVDALMSVSYIRWRLIDGTYWTNLIIAKSKLAPLEKLTVPRIELLSALMNVRLTCKVLKSFNGCFGKTLHIIDSLDLSLLLKPPQLRK